ncbi:hypothetical protein L228DRAFT_250078 [Xylona heveae TC161]|uniref:Aminoglycoside phosphotransferase domain-containing protein n=1 Tax=Xylona heveae (strain CBS 132557 / TC161) TaxID=1328760 RepID=A0A165AFI7_XYLHT|nr:hypothetical protein L228DRAFT_250078 [Xylona heveae TC161]KZF20393.1 hypothetical protein L228DRAFT_250078 [Xylona heveae TC161]
MEYDEVAADKADEVYYAWVKQICTRENLEKLGSLVAKVRSGKKAQSMELEKGAFNACFVFRYEDQHLDTVIRFPQPGRVRFPDEKVEKEVAVMCFVKTHTTIPVPKILEHGKCEFGPYIIMEYVHGNKLSMGLQISEDNAALKEDIDDDKLKKVYRQMADVMVELSRINFPRIGSITDDGTVNGRPLTEDMVFLAEQGNVQPSIQAGKTFSSTRNYLKFLTTQLLHHLETQRHGFIKDEVDCRRKYIARCIFQNIVDSLRPKGRFGRIAPSRLFRPKCRSHLACDDFRPTNVLVDENLQIKAVIDWEFCYAAPAEFGQVAPWWLLLQRPENFQPNLQSFETAFRSKLPLFLEALSESEALAMSRGRLRQSQRTSEKMKKDMENDLELFWIIYAAQNSYAFDRVYWTFIHYRHFKTEREEELLNLLTDEQRKKLPLFVHGKLEDTKIPGLAEW